MILYFVHLYVGIPVPKMEPKMKPKIHIASKNKKGNLSVRVFVIYNLPKSLKNSMKAIVNQFISFLNQQLRMYKGWTNQESRS